MKLKYSGWYVKDLRLCKYNDVKKERIQIADDISEAKEFKDEYEINEFIKKCKLLNYNVKEIEIVEE